MLTPKRVYIYSVSTAGLQSVTWAIISLLRNILITRGEPNTISIAFQIAVIVIGLPVFLVHWSWAQRLAAKEYDERGSVVRRLYLYGNEAAFLIAIVTSIFYLLETLISLPSGRERYTSFAVLPPGLAILYYLIAIIILAVLFYYLYRIIQEDAVVVPEEGKNATVRRGFIYLLVAIGLGMTANALISLIQWILFQIGGGITIKAGVDLMLTHEISRLLVGLPLWVIFWRWAQRLFLAGPQEERESILRKFYEYAVIFIAVFTVVTSAAFILSGIFKELMAVPSTDSSGDIRIPVSIIVVAGVIWAFHAAALRSDEQVQESSEQQVGIRRLYEYLVAGIGLLAFIIGLSGDLSVLIRNLESGSFGGGSKEGLAWFTAIWIIGLAVWILPWRSAQIRALEEGPSGAEDRQSMVRKIYLYFFLFIATMTVLSSVVYILFSILTTIMGEPAPSWGEVAQPIAFSLIAAGVWLYHGYWLREDSRMSARVQADRMKLYRAVLIGGDSSSRLGRAIASIGERFPEITFTTIELDTEDEKERIRLNQEIESADLIIGPWPIAVPGGLNGLITAEIAGAVSRSRGKKLLAPIWVEGWEWIGVERWSEHELEVQTSRAIKQAIQDEDVRMKKPLGAGAIIGITFGVFFLFILLSIPIVLLLSQGLF
jgi:hypothetical protein